jgi:hypothetical protein
MWTAKCKMKMCNDAMVSVTVTADEQWCNGISHCDCKICSDAIVSITVLMLIATSNQLHTSKMNGSCGWGLHASRVARINLVFSFFLSMEIRRLSRQPATYTYSSISSSSSSWHACISDCYNSLLQFLSVFVVFHGPYWRRQTLHHQWMLETLFPISLP